MTLLVVFCGLLTLSFSLPSVTYPTLTSRFKVVVDTCVENVTISSGTFYGYGSSICYCTETSVSCFGYSTSDCTGTIEGSVSWGGCDQLAFPRSFYRIDGCFAAQTAAASGSCSYAVEDGNINDDSYFDSIKPLDTCVDYGCTGTANASDSRSCMWSYDSSEGNVTYRTYDDYVCNDVTSVTKEWGHGNVNDGGEDCSVQISEYSISSSSYYCGSSNSPLEPKVADNVTRNYILMGLQEYPQPIGQCLERQNGFHKYSVGLSCSADDSHVQQWMYLDSPTCSGEGFIVQNFTSDEYHFQCDKAKGRGAWGSYSGYCGYQGTANPDAKYTVSGLLYNQCVPYMRDPNDYDSSGGDYSLFQDQPWNKDLRIVYSCATVGGKSYPIHYFYLRPDCTGEFLFNFDSDEYYSDYQSAKSSRYACKDINRPVIENCNGDGVVDKRHVVAIQ